MTALNGVLAVLSALAIAAAGAVLTWEVIGRYFLGIASDWQDELSTFLLIGATFGSAAWTQARRGHVGIDALAHVLPPGVDRARRLLADSARLLFVAFFAWKSWQLLVEAWDEGQTTPSAWGPPLWIPYGCMTAGMALLALQLLLQVLGSRACRPAPAHLRLAMGTGTIGLMYGGATLLALFSGIPIAFALGGVATVFMMLFMPAASLDTVAQNVYEELASITLLTIPLFILKGAAIGKSRAGKDLYDALHTWLHRVPGGLGVAVVHRLRPVRRHGRVEPGDLLGHRLVRHPGDAAARLLARLRRRAGGGRRHAGHPAAALHRADPVCRGVRAVAGPAVPGRAGPGRAAGGAVRRLGGGELAARVRPRGPGRRGRRGAQRDPAADTLLHARPHGGAAARAAVPAAADRRDGRAVWRHRHPVGDGRARRRAGAAADRR